MRAFRTLALIGLLGLSGCSYTFDVRAVMIDGRLAFMPGPRIRKPECVSGVMVRDEAPLVGETFADWRQATYVWIDEGGYHCADRFPVFYGQVLTGEDTARTGGFEEVAPRPLRVGAIYEVMIGSGATGYGGGRFRLLPDGRVENLGRPTLQGEDAPLVTPRV